MQARLDDGRASPRRRIAAWFSAWLCISLAGCLGPGMRMDTAVRNRADDAAQEAAPALAASVTSINASTIAQLALAARRESVELVGELTRPAPAYTVGPADVLQITLWDHPELALAQGAQMQPSLNRAADTPVGFVVDQLGKIHFPYAGAIAVEGLTTPEIQVRLTEALLAYYQQPQVTVQVASFRAKQVYVDGEVRTPGVQALNDVPMTLTEAIGRAGGFTANADQAHLLLLRAGRSYPLDLSRMVEQGRSPSDVSLLHGDVLRVKSRDASGVFVMGEVNRPVTALPRQDGTLTLADALSQAGSFNVQSSDAKQLYVLRLRQPSGTDGESSPSPGMPPQVFHLDARSPVSMILASRFQLEPRDVVYVDASDVVRVSRVLNLLLPAIDGIPAALVTK
jgi:polysaccharide export outer membrane protein